MHQSEQLGADVPQSLQSLFADGDQWAALIKVLPERAAGLPGLPLADVKLLPCVPRPGKIICYVFYKLNCEPAPLLLGFILGPMMEENLRRALLLSRGDWSTFFTRPISLGLLVAAALLIVVVSMPSIKNRREEAFRDN